MGEIESTNRISREEKLLNAQLNTIGITGEISGNVKDILYKSDKKEKLDKIDKIRKNLKELTIEMYNISDSLNIDFNKILEEVKNDI